MVSVTVEFPSIKSAAYSVRWQERRVDGLRRRAGR